jgi:carnitine 3-dehydrogenase
MPERPGTVGLLGGGVIGGGWAARFLLAGVDVRLYDPDPEAARKLGEILAGARTAQRELFDGEPIREGNWELVDEVEQVAEGVDFIQESVPEQLELKHELLGRLASRAPAGVVIASSTSGLLPSKLQEGMAHPERLVVGHPFNPVYLLPLVEVCPGQDTAPSAVERAAQIYRSVGMHPLRIRKEIDGFVSDRLLEALWREALGLVADGVATAADVDAAIRFGPGLRFAFMGTMLTYRIAGGEGGMRHFMSQFGPALQWPWSKLTDVPEITDDLLDRIEEQSDAQAAGASVRELERVRDRCLVAILRGLREVPYGAGEDVEAFEHALGRTPDPNPTH